MRCVMDGEEGRARHFHMVLIRHMKASTLSTHVTIPWHENEFELVDRSLGLKWMLMEGDILK